MKNSFLTLFAALLLGGTDCPADTPPAATFYVADNGEDANAGTQEKPFATLEAARDAARNAGPGPNRIVWTCEMPKCGCITCGPNRWWGSPATTPSGMR